MRANLDNPIIAHKSISFEQTEIKESKRENAIFKLLLMQNLKNAKIHILHYKNSVSFPKNLKK